MLKQYILVTGATGFVGKHLLPALYDRYEIDIVHRASSDISEIQQWVSNAHTWEDLKMIDKPYAGIIHLAGLAHDTRNHSREQEYIKTNVDLTKTITEFAIKAKAGLLVFLSSIKALGDEQKFGPFTEEQIPHPHTPYGRSKQQAEEFLAGIESDGFRYLSLRPSMMYGKKFKGNLIRLVKFIEKGIPYPFRYYKNKRTLLYVGNLIAVVRACLQHPIENGVYHIADDEAVSTYDLVNLIAEARDKKLRTLPIPGFLIKLLIWILNIVPNKYGNTLNKMLGNMEVDNAKIKTALGWETMPHSTHEAIQLSFRK